MARKHKRKDPHAEREAEKYAEPIASREFIMELLHEESGPCNFEQIAGKLGLTGERELEALSRRLGAMTRDGQLVRNRRGAFGLVSRMELIRGRVIGHRDGFGFLAPMEGGDDLYLSPRQMERVFDGDEVLARVDRVDHRGRREAVIVEVLARNTHELVGRYYARGGVGFVVPDKSRISHEVQIPHGGEAGAGDGQFVVVDIVEQPEIRRRPVGRVTEVLGDHMAPGMETDVAIRSHGIPHKWGDGVVAQAEALGPQVAEDDKRHRVDLRDKPLVTIDGEDARDFDDAVYCERKRGGGWRLWVAIADVSHYVGVRGALDNAALERGNSVYFPDRVVPMLPEALSNGLCSLNPKVDRLCMVCEMSIGPRGRIGSYRFFEGVMRSAARLTYTEVNAAIAGEGGRRREQVRERLGPLVEHLERLYDVFRALSAAREVRGAIDFDTVETKILFDEQRKISRIVPYERNDAHRLIEECMLAANVCAAKFLESAGLPALFRVHQGPKEQKLAELRQYLGELGLDLGGGSEPSPLDYQTLMQQIGDRPDAHVLQIRLLRSLAQAVYQPENIGHFGLNYPSYTHFTSPIRRYPDLLVHRGIRSLIRSRAKVANVERVAGAAPIRREQIYPYDVERLTVLGEHCSMTERRADDATRDVIAWLKCEYLLEHVGEVFEGVVTGVASFGLFIELRDLYIEGLVHVTALANDYYQFDPVGQRLIGERTRQVWQLGDTATVQVVRVDLDERRIDLEPAAAGKEEDITARERRSAGRRKPRSPRKRRAR